MKRFFAESNRVSQLLNHKENERGCPLFDANKHVTQINSLHMKIKFTQKWKKKEHSHFLHLKIQISGKKHTLEIYRKLTVTDIT